METHASASVRDFEQLAGPRGLPLLGNMLQIDPKRFHSILEGWCGQYGSPFRFSLANQHAMGLTAIERPVPAAGRGGLVCAHCGFASAHERAFYCPKCGMRLLRG